MPSLLLQGRFFTGLFLTLFPLQTIIKKICERGGIGRRTGFRILRLAHKGSSPFARTIFHQSKDRRIFLLQ